MPCALTVPLSTALVPVIELAIPVLTIGGPPGPVENEPSDPIAVPVAFVATTRK